MAIEIKKKKRFWGLFFEHRNHQLNTIRKRNFVNIANPLSVLRAARINNAGRPNRPGARLTTLRQWAYSHSVICFTLAACSLTQILIQLFPAPLLALTNKFKCKKKMYPINIYVCASPPDRLKKKKKNKIRIQLQSIRLIVKFGRFANDWRSERNTFMSDSNNITLSTTTIKARTRQNFCFNLET